MNDDRLPSQVHEEVWLERFAPSYERSCVGGKWMIFCPDRTTLDQAWRVVCADLDADRLGPWAKAATPKARDRGRGLPLLVYTLDADDVDDVNRVLRRLRDLGFEGSMSYKEDWITTALVGVKGSGPASFYAYAGSRSAQDRRGSARAVADFERVVTPAGWAASEPARQPSAGDVHLAWLERLDPCARCSADKDLECVDRWLQGEGRVRLSQIACGCGCWTRAIFDGSV